MSSPNILVLVDRLIRLEKQIEEAIANEKDARKRKAYAKAYRDRDLDRLRELLFSL